MITPGVCIVTEHAFVSGICIYARTGHVINFRLAESDLPGPAYVKAYRGGMTFVLSRGIFLPEQAASLTAASRQVFELVPHFQMWNGEIVELGLPVEEPSLLHQVRQR